MYTYKYRHDLQEGEDFVYVKGVLDAFRQDF